MFFFKLDHPKILGQLLIFIRVLRFLTTIQNIHLTILIRYNVLAISVVCLLTGCQNESLLLYFVFHFQLGDGGWYFLSCMTCLCNEKGSRFIPFKNILFNKNWLNCYWFHSFENTSIVKERKKNLVTQPINKTVIS